jgi:hypothetical protein
VQEAEHTRRSAVIDEAHRWKRIVIIAVKDGKEPRPALNVQRAFRYGASPKSNRQRDSDQGQLDNAENHSDVKSRAGPIDDFIRGIRHLPLSFQIALGGVLSLATLALCSGGLFLVAGAQLIDRGWRSRIVGAAIFCVSFPLCVWIAAWLFSGDPYATWEWWIALH